METSIRPATIHDSKAILEIVNDAILNSTAIYDYDVRTLEQQITWLEEKKISGFPVIVATNNSEIIGFATYGTFRFKIGYRFTVEHSVYVKKGFSGKGIGGMLLSELISLAKTQNYHTMIGCIDAENSGSIAFHEKFGFVKSGILKEVGFKFGKWLDLQFMQLMI